MFFPAELQTHPLVERVSDVLVFPLQCFRSFFPGKQKTVDFLHVRSSVFGESSFNQA
jgi:hypothetical protein